MFELVADFHQAFGLPIGKSTVSLTDNKYRDLRITLLKEEYNEFIQAENEDDFIEIADALADMLYIIGGTLITYGLDYNYSPPFNAPVGKPKFPPIDLRTMLVGMTTVAHRNYMKAEVTNDPKVISSTLRILANTVFATALIYSIPLTAIFTEVHRSNMAKLGEDGKPIYREDGKVIKPANWQPPNIMSVLEQASLNWTGITSG